MILRHRALDLTVTFYTCVGSHLLGERSGWFAKRSENARSIFIDNGVFALLRNNRRLGPREVVKYGYRNIRQILGLVRKRDVEIYIVIPDYPFDRKLNYECYRLFRQHFCLLFKDYKTVYVLHGYWEAILDGVDVDLLAIPFNTLTDVPIKSLRGRKSYRLDQNVLTYVLVKTIEHCKQHGYTKVHLLGPTGLTLRRIFRPLQAPIEMLDGTRIDNSFLQHIVSFDTASWHMDPDARLGQGRILIDDRSKEQEWVMKWLNKVVQHFEIVQF